MEMNNEPNTSYPSCLFSRLSAHGIFGCVSIEENNMYRIYCGAMGCVMLRMLLVCIRS
jgi:hypothetical protein